MLSWSRTRDHFVKTSDVASAKSSEIRQQQLLQVAVGFDHASMAGRRTSRCLDDG